MTKKELWAYCHRAGMGINTNMLVEAFHRVFKYNYLKGKFNKRVDTCLFNLLKFVRDKSFERLIKLTKGKCHYKLKVIQDRHGKSKGMSYKLINKVGESKWTVQSEDTRSTYTVTQLLGTCKHPSCDLKCLECNICIHQYICSCPDNLIQSTICKHVHHVQQFLLRMSLSNDKCHDTMATKSNDTERFNYVEQELSDLTEFINQSDNHCYLTTCRERVRGKLLSLLAQLETCEDKLALQELQKHLNAGQSIFTSLQKRKPLKELKVTSKATANKKIETQPRFYSTKKKRKRKSNMRFAKPTKEEVQVLFENLERADDLSTTELTGNTT